MNGYSGGWDVIFPGLTCPATFLPSRWQPSSGEARGGEGRGGEEIHIAWKQRGESESDCCVQCSAGSGREGGREAVSHPLTHPRYHEDPDPTNDESIRHEPT